MVDVVVVTFEVQWDAPFMIPNIVCEVFQIEKGTIGDESSVSMR
jgi:hypothetical protein